MIESDQIQSGTVYLIFLYHIPAFICFFGKKHESRWQKAWNIDCMLQNMYIIIYSVYD